MCAFMLATTRDPLKDHLNKGASKGNRKILEENAPLGVAEKNRVIIAIGGVIKVVAIL